MAEINSATKKCDFRYAKEILVGLLLAYSTFSTYTLTLTKTKPRGRNVKSKQISLVRSRSVVSADGRRFFRIFTRFLQKKQMARKFKCLCQAFFVRFRKTQALFQNSRSFPKTQCTGGFSIRFLK